MPLRNITGANFKYYLCIFDEQGKEREESDGALLSDAILRRLASAPPVTDIFLMSHGWQGDVPAAIRQYDAWVGEVARSAADLDAVRRGRPGFEPLVAGIHWPSLPWGDETIPSGGGVLSADDSENAPIDSEVDAYASRIADTPAARAAIRTILEAARTEENPHALSEPVRGAYATLFAESGLGLAGVGGAPGADQEAFNPAAIVKDATRGDPAAAAAGAPGLLGFGDGLKDLLLSPLRQLSFWKMKDRGRQIGENAGHVLLNRLMSAAPNARVHLMGHSFGCIVVSAAVAGAAGGRRLPRPVDTLFLVQGALSIWAYTDDIPYEPGVGGYFRRIVADRLVSGPIVTTRSTHDRAVGFFYPLGAGAAGQIVLDVQDYPPFGGLGAFGIRGVASAEDRVMLPARSRYGFEPGRIANLEASDVIKNGDGASGAHSDIAHPEVAHAFWEAAFPDRETELRPVGAGRVLGWERGGLLSGLLADDRRPARDDGAAPQQPRRQQQQRDGQQQQQQQQQQQPQQQEQEGQYQRQYQPRGGQQQQQQQQGGQQQQQQQQGDGQYQQQQYQPRGGQQQQQQQQGGQQQQQQQQQGGQQQQQQQQVGGQYQQQQYQPRGGQQQQQQQQGGQQQQQQQQQGGGQYQQQYQPRGGQQQQQQQQGGQQQQQQQQQQQDEQQQQQQQQQQQDEQYQQQYQPRGRQQQQQQQREQQEPQPQRQQQPPPPPPPPQQQSPPQPATPSLDRRWINAEVEGNPRGKSLIKGTQYRLAFDVDTEQRATAVAAPLDDSQIFASGVEEAGLTVQLNSVDFDIDKPTDSLVVPREGRSTRNASFRIVARHDGASEITATIHFNGNFIQQMKLRFDVGAAGDTPVAVSALGRPLSAVPIVQPRDLGLSISPSVGGYDCTVWGAVAARARLPIPPAELAKAVDVARNELLKVVMWREPAGKYAFQTETDIPDAGRDFALTTLARAGAALFRKLFWSPAAAADANKVGDFLRRMATETPKLRLQILADSAPIPWGLLYMGDASLGAKLDWSNFLGVRHVIEMIPLQNTLAVSASEIPSDRPTLAVSVNVNRGIDSQMGVDLVARQEGYWDGAGKLGGVHVVSRTTKAELVRALASGNADDQILYFYCHAKSADLSSADGPDSACLVLTDGRVTLGELNLDAPTSAQLRGNPLVFVNACESAEMSPAFYDGFVPYFMAKGARGVIGTECQTPALFAAEWAKRFFPLFLGGETLGEAFLALRKAFLEEHGNPLGLIYAVHSDGDTRVAPPLASAN